MLAAALAALLGVIFMGAQAKEAVAATGTRATIEATQFTVEPDKSGEGFAVCRDNKRAVGGGVVQSGSPVGILVHASGPLGSTGSTAETQDGDIAKQWYAAVRNGSQFQQTLKVFALCSDKSDATIEAATFSPDSSGLSGATAVCPGKKRALGGGMVQSGLPEFLYAGPSGPLDSTGKTSKTQDGDIAKQWYAAVDNDTGVQRTFKVFALCSRNSDATIEATAFKAGPWQQDANAFAKCSGKKRALGGGVLSSGSSSDLGMRASGPLDNTGVTAETQDGDIAKQWYAAASNSADVQRTFKVMAVCE